MLLIRSTGHSARVISDCCGSEGSESCASRSRPPPAHLPATPSHNHSVLNADDGFQIDVLPLLLHRVCTRASTPTRRLGWNCRYSTLYQDSIQLLRPGRHAVSCGTCETCAGNHEQHSLGLHFAPIKPVACPTALLACAPPFSCQFDQRAFSCPTNVSLVPARASKHTPSVEGREARQKHARGPIAWRCYPDKEWYHDLSAKVPY